MRRSFFDRQIESKKQKQGAIFLKTGRAGRRHRAYAAGAYRENAHAYEKSRQDRQSLQTDPIGYEDSLNLYMYALNDPLNYIDPNGKEAWLISRPAVLGQNHLFVAVRNDETGEVTRFSYGPSSENQLATAVGLDRLVSLTDSGMATDRGDAGALTRFLRDPAEAREAGISGVRINASDAAVITAGEQMNATLGTADDPGRTRYTPLPNESSMRSWGANSNSAAYDVANTAVQSENPDATQPLPPGTRNPGWEQDYNINPRR